ncbi:MAG: choice-of-anchor J domain-containing protein, partial [Bacteroidota bacterium]
MKRLLSVVVVMLAVLALQEALAAGERTARVPGARIQPLVTRGPALECVLAGFTESFEGTTFPPAGWSKISPDGGTGWNRQTAGTSPVPGWTGGAITVPAGGGTAVAFATWNTGGASSNDQWLVTPQITNVAASDSLKFWVRYWPNSFADTLEVRISTTGTAAGDFTILVQELGYGGLSTDDTNWNQYRYRLTDYVSAGANIYIAFRERVADNFNDGSSFSLDVVEVGTPAAEDIQVSSVLLTPASPNAGQPVTVSAVIANVGTGTNPGSVPVTYKVGSVPASSGDGTAETFTPTWTGNVDTVTFAVTYTPPSAGFLTIGVRSFYGPDLNGVNDSALTTIEVNPAGTILAESFTGAAFPPAGWSATASCTGTYWGRLTAVQPNGASGPAARLNFYNRTTGCLDTLRLPPLNLSALDPVPKILKFDHAYRSYNTETDSVRVIISSDGGATWGLLFNDGGSSLATLPPATSSFTPSAASDWRGNIIPIPSAYLVPVCDIAFVGLSDFGNNFWLDNVRVEQEFLMTYVSGTVTQNTAKVLQGSTEAQVIGIEVVTSGTASPIAATRFLVSAAGTTTPADISNAKLFYTGTSSTFSTATPFGSPVPVPGATPFWMTGSQTLATGTNYFWLTFDVSGTATPGQVVDATCDSATVNGSDYELWVRAPAGSREIVAPMAAGDYAVGLAPFNEATGRRLYHQRFTRKIMRPVDVAEPGAKSILPETEASTSGPHTVRMTEAEEEYFVLMEEGAPYTGPRSAVRQGGAGESALGVYATITDALADLNLRGVAGHVRFLLTDATYPSETYPLTIRVTSPFPPGPSATVTIKPSGGVAPAVTGGPASGPLFRILGTNHITMDGSNTVGGTTRDLTLTSTTATLPNVLHVGSLGAVPITNITVKNCVLINGAQTSSGVVISDGSTLGNGGLFSDITVENNSIQKAYIGVYATGGTVPQGGTNLSYIGNDLETAGANAVRYIGLYMQGVNGATVRGNRIGNFEQASGEIDRGMWLATGTINALVEKNLIHDLVYGGASGYGGKGIYISTAQSPADITVRNNFIYNIAGDGDSYSSSLNVYNPSGIYAFTAQTGVSIYFNSIHLYGNMLNYAGALSQGITVDTPTVADIRNNVIVNNLGLAGATGYGSAGVFLRLPSALGTIDYNNYFVNPTGSGVKAVGQLGAAASLTLGAWQTATGQEAGGVYGDPLFTGPTDLHITSGSSPASGAGATIGTVGDDYDGDVRLSPPDIGADEFTGTTVNVSVPLIAGWNMVSNPVTRAAGTDSMKQVFTQSLFAYGF